jgi:hypothetical protein
MSGVVGNEIQETRFRRLDDGSAVRRSLDLRCHFYTSYCERPPSGSVII